jgi:hypothetical protein
MRFKKYITEATVEPRKKDITVCEKTFKDVFKRYKKGEWGMGLAGVKKAMKEASHQISKNLKDIRMDFTSKDKFRPEAYSMPMEHQTYIKVEYSAADTRDAWQMKTNKTWIYQMMELIKHELVHAETYRRIMKASKKDYDKFFDILLANKNMSKKFSNEFDGYLADHLEIMAHAKHAAEQLLSPLSDFSKEEIIDKLRGKDMVELTYESDAFESYFYHIKVDYPKVWKKFIKYLVEYIRKK